LDSGWRDSGFTARMDSTTAPVTAVSPKPICVGLTCWRWQKTKARLILGLGQKFGVTIQLTERIHGLRREIEAQVSGANTDRFIGEFVRHC
jgi:hypothetical protein